MFDDGKDDDTHGTIRTGLRESGLAEIGEAVVSRLSAYVHELARWNRRINLTGKRTGKEIASELLYDAFFLSPYVEAKDSVLDMGSGSGILAIPFAIMNRDLQVISVDANAKKIDFQRHVKRSLALSNLVPLLSRIEDLSPQGVAVVVAKAFGATPEVLEKAARHVLMGGQVMLVKGRSEPEASFPGFALEGVSRYSLPGSPKEFKLIVYKKIP